MRLAIVSDIHGNLTALDAVLADLRTVAPDLVVQGGDLVGNGSQPAEVIDRIRDLQWPGVQGNTDEMLWRPDRLASFAEQVPQLKPLMDIVSAMADACTAAIGDERLQWLQRLPMQWCDYDVAVAVRTD